MKYVEKYAALLECNTEPEWMAMLLQLAGEQGYERTLLAVTPDRHTLRDVFIRSNYPTPWRSTYDDAGYANIDPVVNHCIKRSTALIWEPETFSGQAQREMYEEACGYGIRAGVTLPFHGADGELGMLCCVNDAEPGKRFRSDAMRKIQKLSLLRDFALESSLRFARPSWLKGECPALTRRELECLKWCAAGKSSWEIALILHCTERTVNFHFNNLCRKLNVVSRRQAVVKAIHLGLIHTN